MMEVYEVLIFASGNVANTLSEAVENHPKTKSLGTLYNEGQLASGLSKYKKMVILVDTISDPMILTRVAPIIKNKQMKILALANNVKEGFERLAQGADEIGVMPKSSSPEDKRAFASILATKISKIYKEYDDQERVLKNRYNREIKKIIVIGSSTGGTECIAEILRGLPADAPPVLIVQHMPAVFTKLYSIRLHGEAKMSVWEAQDGDELLPGLALVAPGDMQMRLVRRGGKLQVTCKKEGLVDGHMPSVNALFETVADVMGKDVIGVMLTGMGADGARGMLKMKQKGAYNIGQTEESCIVYGMPKVAFEMGAVSVQAAPAEMPRLIMTHL